MKNLIIVERDQKFIKDQFVKSGVVLPQYKKIEITDFTTLSSKEREILINPAIFTWCSSLQKDMIANITINSEDLEASDAATILRLAYAKRVELESKKAAEQKEKDDAKAKVINANRLKYLNNPDAVKKEFLCTPSLNEFDQETQKYIADTLEQVKKEKAEAAATKKAKDEADTAEFIKNHGSELLKARFEGGFDFVKEFKKEYATFKMAGVPYLLWDDFCNKYDEDETKSPSLEIIKKWNALQTNHLDETEANFLGLYSVGGSKDIYGNLAIYTPMGDVDIVVKL